MKILIEQELNLGQTHFALLSFSLWLKRCLLPTRKNLVRPENRSEKKRNWLNWSHYQQQQRFLNDEKKKRSGATIIFGGTVSKLCVENSMRNRKGKFGIQCRPKIILDDIRAVEKQHQNSAYLESYFMPCCTTIFLPHKSILSFYSGWVLSYLICSVWWMKIDRQEGKMPSTLVVVNKAHKRKKNEENISFFCTRNFGEACGTFLITF